MNDNDTLPLSGIALIVLMVLLLISGLMAGCPMYNVWQQGLKGQAELARAEQNRKIAVQEAMAREESSKLLAQMDINRAEGVAKANQIIGKSLKENEDYLIWLWIEALKESDNQVIYVATESNLPVLEAGRFGKSVEPRQHPATNDDPGAPQHH